MPNLKVNSLNKPYRFNMVNSTDERLIQLGLEPLYITLYPRYINLNGNIFYGGNQHFECNFINDIVNILKIMNSNTYDRFETVGGFLGDNYTIYFSIYNNQIFFCDLFSLSIYKNNKNIREIINKKYNLDDNFYEPTDEEIWQNYGEEYYIKNCYKYGNNIEYGSLNLTPKEFLDIRFLSKKNEFIPYTNPNMLDASDVRHWLNYNANIFMSFKCPKKITGVYNQKTMDYINSLKETKFDIYKVFYDLSKKSKNWQYTIIELLKKMGVYAEFRPPEIAPEDIFCTNIDTEKQLYWSRMFAAAANDILIQYVGFDKIETQLSRTITTSKQNIYEKYFNLFLMDYNIVQLPRLVFDEVKQKFKWITPSEFYNSGINRECEEEIKLIKKYIPYE